MLERLSLPSVKIALGVIGLLCVLYGAADAFSRVARATLGAHANSVAFGPAIEMLQSSSFASTTTPVRPARLVIPAIGVDATVEQVGQKADGSMATPSNFGAVAWYKLGSQPGAPGNAVIAGHVNNALTKVGVFEHLSDLTVGDVVAVTDASGHTLRFAVHDIEDYPSASAPLSSIFATTGPSQIVLITCDGDWDPRAHSYDHRLVIYAGLLAQ